MPPLHRLLLSAVFFVGTCLASAAADRPNLILIMADDFGYECVTANGGKSYQTPNLDRLAAEGVRLPMTLTHDPFQPTPDSPNWDPEAVGERVNRDTKHFADMTAYMDKLIGRLDAKLAELGIRENTLLMFLGDNGTHSSVTSRFKGSSYQGGKGTTTARGTHVPFVANWPAAMAKGRVCQDLVGEVDFLPTLCEAAGIPVHELCDGVSFLPQLKGEPGTPHEALYLWYSSRQRPDLSVKEYAFDHKLYRDGRLFDLVADPFEEADPLLPEAAPEARAKLRSVLERYADARPEALDRAVLEPNPAATSALKAGKRKARKE